MKLFKRLSSYVRYVYLSICIFALIIVCVISAWWNTKCPYCGSRRKKFVEEDDYDDVSIYKCKNCLSTYQAYNVL